MNTIEELKQHSDILSIASMYCELQKQNGSYKARVNPLRDENTSSLFFYPDTQKFHDFGSGESGDVLDFIQAMERCTLSEAKEKLSSFTGIMPLHVKSEPVNKSITPKALQEEFNTFEVLTMTNPKHKEELLNICPLWLYKEADKTDLYLFQSITRYDAKNNTLVSGWYDNNDLSFDMVTYKRRRYLGGKWVNRADTHPNQTAFQRIFKEKEKVYIIEGMRDALTAILLGLNFVALPTTAYRNFDAFKGILRGKDEVVYIVEDQQGFKCMSELDKVARGEMICLSDADEKMDLSDFTMTKNSIKEVINEL